ncbi:MAG: TonB-dependent receptor [Bacteroidetes bacterium]|nr:TonB-dependent receptor [Bacteroidota bacterium]
MSFHKSLLFILLFIIGYPAFSQEKAVFRGQVMDAGNLQGLVGTNVYWEGQVQQGTLTDVDGNFLLPAITLPAKIILSYLGYEKSTRTIQVRDLEKVQRFYLKAVDFSLEEVLIQEKRGDEQVKNLELGKSTLSMETLQSLPALFGEVDLLRSLQLLPGVKSAGEGTTGLFVRGGSSDQNLIQVDGAPVYNASHFFGIFSVFNPDGIKKVDLYKGNMPASFGSRASSLIDVILREGEKDRIQGEGGIGTISSRMTLQGPLLGDKHSFLISGRRTYADLFLKLSSNPDLNNNQLNFYDLNGKAAFTLTEKDKLSLSSYQGSDYLGLDGQFGLGWKNWVSAVNWNRVNSDSSFFDLQSYHSRYSYQVKFDNEENGFDWTNSLSESGIKASWTRVLSSTTTLVWGAHGQVYHFAPTYLKPSVNNPINRRQTQGVQGVLGNAFVGLTREFTDKLSGELGLRQGIYAQLGEGKVYKYNGNAPNPDQDPSDSLFYERSQLMQRYQGLEPRIAFRYLLRPEFSLKLAYNRNFQYVQIASNSSAGLPIDRWVLASQYIRPIQSDQVSLGLFHNFNENRWEFSVEGYYKNLQDVIDLRNGARILLSDEVETELLSGRGWAYGAEFLLRKNRGKTTGWLAYTWSRAWRQIDGISRDKPYNPRFDRPHDISLVLNHKFSSSWSAGLTFVYSTGQAVSFPVGSYVVDNQPVSLYSDFRNEDRFPDYHRLDATVTWENTDQGKKWKGSWNFGVYNIYGRKNPFSYDFRVLYNNELNFNPSDGKVFSTRPGVVMTYLFAFLPSLTYNFQF